MVKIGSKPKNIKELHEISKKLSGCSIADLTKYLLPMYESVTVRDKGYIGKLVEHAYGCGLQNKAGPDLTELHVELKTLPITSRGRILETTFICHCLALNQQSLHWKSSLVYQKLQRILWIPIITASDQPKTVWKLGSPFLWSPDTSVMKQLEADWEELMEAWLYSGLDQVSSLYGEILQLRPKALNSRITTQGWNARDYTVPAHPKGFYLRRAFTQAVLNQHFSPSKG